MSEGTVIKSPGGQEWCIGERVGYWPEDGCEPVPATIVGYWDGDWNPRALDVDSFWFKLDNGLVVRPYLVCKPHGDPNPYMTEFLRVWEERPEYISGHRKLVEGRKNKITDDELFALSIAAMWRQRIERQQSCLAQK